MADCWYVTYTPTGEEMREAWVYMQHMESVAGEKIAKVQAANFFAAHDRLVRADVLAEAVSAVIGAWAVTNDSDEAVDPYIAAIRALAMTNPPTPEVLPNRAPYDKCSAHNYVEAGKEQVSDE